MYARNFRSVLSISMDHNSMKGYIKSNYIRRSDSNRVIFLCAERFQYALIYLLL